MTMKSTAERPALELGHSMKPRQLTMMGLGSAIGAGLFLGSGAGVQAAGPAVLVSYLVAGTLIILVMWALGEMAAANPNSGAFSVYAEKAMGKTAGATVGWLWWLQLVVVIAAEALGAAGLLFTVWPVIPVWALALIFMVVFTAINLAGVKNFGEFEFWFAILKVAAIVLFLAIGAALLLGWLPDVASPGLANITSDFAPAGLGGIATALFVVIFAFGGTEIVSVAAAETENPEHSVGQAIRTVRLADPGLLHRLGLRHRRRPSGHLRRPRSRRSPASWTPPGIPGAGTAITLVAVVALLSALNANLYGASRMVFSLVRTRRGPRFLSQPQQRPGAGGRRRRLGGLRLHRHRPGTAVPGADPAGAVPAGRLHLPGGLGHGPGVPADPPPPGGPGRHRPAAADEGLPGPDDLRAGAAGA